MSDVFNLLQTKMRLSYNRVVVLVLAAALLSARALQSAPPPPSWAPVFVERFEGPQVLERVTLFLP